MSRPIARKFQPWTTRSLALSVIKTGKDGKPASSSHEDLELTRTIILQHQEKYINQSRDYLSSSSTEMTAVPSSPYAALSLVTTTTTTA